MKKLFVVAAISCLLMVEVNGCGSSKEAEFYTAEERFAEAMKKFHREDYLDAVEDFKNVTVQFPGSAYADSAQFFMGECRYLREEYILAAAEYDLLIRTMSSSPLVLRARYMKAMSNYELSPKSELDQKFTKEAIDDFQSFIEYYPTDSLAKVSAAKIVELNNKLAKKEYDNGKLYLRLEYFKSAIAYFDLVLDRYHDSDYADDALLGKATALRERHDYAAALDAVNLFFQKYPASRLKSDAETLKAAIEADLAAPKPAPKKSMGLSTNTGQ
ncbi:MAG TPA: outer membrane protein assembly factor BamD [Bacteroidota bacterium]|nr:outer membrane protein assembly factor BamD [Bacteroidota bacterium]